MTGTVHLLQSTVWMYFYTSRGKSVFLPVKVYEKIRTIESISGWSQSGPSRHHWTGEKPDPSSKYERRF